MDFSLVPLYFILFAVIALPIFIQVKKRLLMGDSSNHQKKGLEHSESTTGESRALLLNKRFSELLNAKADPIATKGFRDSTINLIDGKIVKWSDLDFSEEILNDLVRLSQVQWCKDIIKKIQCDEDYSSADYPNFIELIDLHVSNGTTTWQELGISKEELNRVLNEN
ncbi:MAG: hypothetical protein NUV82_01715 [Candidatus Komeilibacteria bacterium]|nr:hypothetical protein [Candidatus Komeilibacteria bacterium]